MREIKFYKLSSGRSPVEEYLDSLTAKEARKVTWVLRLVEELEIVPSQYFQKMPGTDGLWEVRIQFGGNIFRLLGFFAGDKVVILNHGFTKKSQKTPPKEIKIAEERKKDYLKEKRNKR